MRWLPGRVLLANLRQRSTLWLFLRSFLTVLGLTAGLSGLISGLFPDFAKEHAWLILSSALVTSLIFAIRMGWPRAAYSRDFTLPRVTVSIVVGDLFTQDGHLVIGMTDTFDTQPPILISPTSVQGQLLEHAYTGDVAAFDDALVSALDGVRTVSRETREAKPLGKLDRYPIGTVAVLGSPDRYYYGLAYGKMGNDYVVESSVSYLWTSLMALWPAVRRTSHLGTVSITPLGMGLARLSGRISPEDVVRLIVITFLTSSRDRVVASHLRIVLSPAIAESIDLRHLADYLNTVQ